MMLPRRSDSIARRSSLPGPSRCSCPTISSMERGRMRAARGGECAPIAQSLPWSKSSISVSSKKTLPQPCRNQPLFLTNKVGALANGFQVPPFEGMWAPFDSSSLIAQSLGQMVGPKPRARQGNFKRSLTLLKNRQKDRDQAAAEKLWSSSLWRLYFCRPTAGVSFCTAELNPKYFRNSIKRTALAGPRDNSSNARIQTRTLRSCDFFYPSRISTTSSFLSCFLTAS